VQSLCRRLEVAHCGDLVFGRGVSQKTVLNYSKQVFKQNSDGLRHSSAAKNFVRVGPVNEVVSY